MQQSYSMRLRLKRQVNFSSFFRFLLFSKGFFFFVGLIVDWVGFHLQDLFWSKVLLGFSYKTISTSFLYLTLELL